MEDFEKELSLDADGNAEFRDKVSEFLEKAKQIDPKWSQSRLASMANVSTSVISQLLTGTYKGETEIMKKKVIAIIDREKTNFEASIKRPSFATTKLYQKMSYMMTIAQSDKLIAVFGGKSGIGKTVALREFVKENQHIILVEANPTYTATTVLEKIGNLMQIPNHGRKDRMMDAIIERLRNTKRMMITDEAEYLPVKSLDILRRIYDQAEIPLVLCGTLRLYKNILSTREQMAQIYNRMVYVQLSGIDMEDAYEILCTVFPSPTEELTKVFFDASVESDKTGNARKLTQLINLAQREAIYNHTHVTPAVVLKARELLM